MSLGIALAGCGPLAALAEAPVPCQAQFSVERCDALAGAAATDLGVDPNAVSALEILPDPEPDTMRLGGPPVFLRVHLADGTAHETVVRCPGIAASYVPACMEDPALTASSATMNGYRDVPCFDNAGTQCATPVPPVEADAAAAAQPIEVERQDIPIDRVGSYEVALGAGALPNGILTEASFRLVDDWPDGVTVDEARVLLDVRSLEPDGKPFDNYYLHGWREGVERVEAVLVFDVRRFEPGAVLSVEDVIVR